MGTVLLLVSFFASTAGAICGIGGGIIMKPLLDTLHLADAATISFLSSCTVFSMSCYSVGKEWKRSESPIASKTVTPLAFGAALGGIIGNRAFGFIANRAAKPQSTGGYQALCLSVVTLFTLLYILFQNRIKTQKYKNPAFCGIIGLCLGAMSSFLGIGGGPVNLVVLHFFFSMSAKTTALNSLYIIFISQAANILTTLLQGNTPALKPIWLVLMVVGGILGGGTGRKLNRQMSERQINTLLKAMICLIFCISCWNARAFLP